MLIWITGPKHFGGTKQHVWDCRVKHVNWVSVYVPTENLHNKVLDGIADQGNILELLCMLSHNQISKCWRNGSGRKARTDQNNCKEKKKLKNQKQKKFVRKLLLLELPHSKSCSKLNIIRFEAVQFLNEDSFRKISHSNLGINIHFGVGAKL